MKLTKFEHSCFVLEENGERLVVDPGEFSMSLNAAIPGVTAVVVTHVHSDHIDVKKIKQILKQNPSAQLFTTAETAASHPELPCIAVVAGDTRDVGQFHLEFFGGQHAVIYPDKPVFENVGIVINESVAYPGDSFVDPGKPVTVLLAPAAAPWLKIKEAVDYITAANAENIIPTHDAILSLEGKDLHDAHLRTAAELTGKTYTRLAAGKTLAV